MKKFLVIALLAACYNYPDNVKEEVWTPVAPQLAIGTWENDEGVTFYLNATSYGKDWLIYGWTMPGCEEGGFAQAMGQQLLLGGFDPETTCFSKISPNYTAEFSMSNRGELEVSVSVQEQPIALTRK